MPYSLLTPLSKPPPPSPFQPVPSQSPPLDWLPRINHLPPIQLLSPLPPLPQLLLAMLIQLTEFISTLKMILPPVLGHLTHAPVHASLLKPLTVPLLELQSQLLIFQNGLLTLVVNTWSPTSKSCLIKIPFQLRPPMVFSPHPHLKLLIFQLLVLNQPSQLLVQPKPFLLPLPTEHGTPLQSPLH